MEDGEIGVIATFIATNRAKAVWDKYYQEVTKENYKRLSGSTKIKDNGKTRYYMLRKRYYSAPANQKSGAPVDKKKAHRAVKESENLMEVNMSSDIKVLDGHEYIDVVFTVSDREYMASDNGIFEGSNQDRLGYHSDKIVTKSQYGEISGITKTIIDGIDDWADKEGYKIEIESSMEAD